MNPRCSPDETHFRGSKETWKNTLVLSFQSLGVVYGRLSTAPLYVFGTIAAEDFRSSDTVYEYFSFIFWTLTIISLLKYAFIVLEADDDGEGNNLAKLLRSTDFVWVVYPGLGLANHQKNEGGVQAEHRYKFQDYHREHLIPLTLVGGTFALYSLLCRHSKVCLLPSDRCVVADEIVDNEEGNPSCTKVKSRARRAIEKHRSSHYVMLFLALFGACMIIGDGVLTPSISDVPVPLACGILVCLFMLQHYGTRKLGCMFAPVVILWLFFIGGVGMYNICYSDPKIIHAASPYYIYRFIKNKRKSWKSLGSILLCVAGSEAMFADLGHFSKKSIKITFICLIYPLLVLCYAGQAAFISTNLNAYGDFNHLRRSVPRHLRHVFVLLSLLASAVGSQATITASFSIINQCLALGCFPRVKVIHTSYKRRGRVYIPYVNWLLMFLSITITLAFHNTHRIANAAGMAIISGMVVTTCLMSLVIALCWEKSLFISGCFLFFFGFIEVTFLSACLLSFHKGAWYLVILLALSLTSMLAWHYGTTKKYEFDFENKVSTEWLTDLSPGLGVARVPGIGLIYTAIVSGIPAFFSHFITNLPAFHQVLIFVSFKSQPVPYVPASQRYLVGRVGAKDYRIYRCIVRYGYCDRERDTDDFEEQIIASIGEFILQEDTDEESLSSPEGKMIVVGNSLGDGSALIPLHDTVNNDEHQTSTESELIEGATPIGKTKKVRFMLPRNSSPKMPDSVKEELQDIVNARESGTAYFLGQPHLSVRDGSNFIKKFMIACYVFLDKNCRELPLALNIPHAALVEVSTVYTI